jgi:hypothetical protein
MIGQPEDEENPHQCFVCPARLICSSTGSSPA